MRRFILLLTLVVPAALAQQGPIPINAQTQDYISPVTMAINNLVTNTGGTFLTTGTHNC
jgi:hypothetical protein